jgi:hypothetical protein
MDCVFPHILVFLSLLIILNLVYIRTSPQDILHQPVLLRYVNICFAFMIVKYMFENERGLNILLQIQANLLAKVTWLPTNWKSLHIKNSTLNNILKFNAVVVIPSMYLFSVLNDCIWNAFKKINRVTDPFKCNGYFTVMAENAIKHIADNDTRNVPQSRKFQRSSKLCRNLNE